MRRRTALSIAATLATSLALAPAALATFPGANGQLLYQRDSQIWASNPDGTGERRITQTNGESGVWSPDGRRITFDIALQASDGYSGIWTVNADGSERRRLPTVPESWFPTDPTWSRDAKRIIFRGDARLPSPPYPQYSEASGIRIIDRDGTDEEWVLIDNAADGTGEPIWSPTTDEIVYLQSDSRIAIMDLKDRSTRWYHASHDWPAGHPCELREFGADPCVMSLGKMSWSPDGTRLLYATKCEIGLPYDPAPCPGELPSMSILELDDFTRHVLPVEGRDPVWSPDGKQIAFTRELGKPFEEFEPGEVWDPAITLFVMNADGTDIHQVARGSEPDWQAIPPPKHPTTPTTPTTPHSPSVPDHDYRPPPTSNPTTPRPPAPPRDESGVNTESPLVPRTPATDHPGVRPKMRVAVRVPARVRFGKALRLTVVFSAPTRSRVRLQEKRGGRWVTVRSRLVSGTRTTFTVRPRRGAHRFRVTHPDGQRIVKVRVL